MNRGTTAIHRESDPGATAAGGQPASRMQTHEHMNGWLDPEGRFYPLDLPSQHCQWCLDRKMADCNRSLTDPRCVLDELGWFKLSKGTWIVFLPYKATQHQIDFVWDWYLGNQKEPDDLIKLLREFNP